MMTLICYFLVTSDPLFRRAVTVSEQQMAAETARSSTLKAPARWSDDMSWCADITANMESQQQQSPSLHRRRRNMHDAAAAVVLLQMRLPNERRHKHNCQNEHAQAADYTCMPSVTHMQVRSGLDSFLPPQTMMSPICLVKMRSPLIPSIQVTWSPPHTRHHSQGCRIHIHWVTG